MKLVCSGGFWNCFLGFLETLLACYLLRRSVMDFRRSEMAYRGQTSVGAVFLHCFESGF